MAGLVFGVIGNLVLAPNLRAAAIGYTLLLIIPNLIMWLGNVPPFSVINTNLFLIPWVTLSALLSYFLDRKNRNAFRFEAQFERLASTDLLTGVNNRHSLMDLAAKELSRARRYDHPLSLLVLDIDDFKRINDTHGHSVGDQAIKQLASICSGTLRAADIFGRLGGDEFAAVLPETDSAEAFKLAERLRLTLAANGVRVDDGTLRFTVSIGGAGLSDLTEDIDAVMRRADTALYEAKRQGRNRVVMADNPTTSSGET
jgi:diguanylate cyclase (GGDEF)-like protein